MTRVSTRAIERRVCDFVARAGALRRRERVLLMLSGGADSMAMLALVCVADERLGLGLGLGALHVDYGLRGAESTRDRRIVERACAAAGIELEIVLLEAGVRGSNFQARARDVRYAKAHEIAAERGFDTIVTAHNRDDQAETMLYRLSKYASPQALVGMRAREPATPGRVALARPLLCIGADEVRAYCRLKGIGFGEDATNAQLVYARNVVRHEVLARLRELNPRVAETLAASAEIAAAERDVLDAAVGAALSRVVVPADGGEIAALDVAALAREPDALRTLCLRAFIACAFGPDALVERREIEGVARLAGRRDDAGAVHLRGGWEVVRGGGRLRLRRRAPAHDCAPVTVRVEGAGTTAAPALFCGRRFAVEVVDGPLFPRGDSGGRTAPRGREAFVGLDEPPGRLVLRHPVRGDRFWPLGLARETTVARFLAAAKTPADARRCAVVLEVGGAVAWVGHESPAGERRGRVAQPRRVTESTVCTLHVVEEAG